MAGLGQILVDLEEEKLDRLLLFLAREAESVMQETRLQHPLRVVRVARLDRSERAEREAVSGSAGARAR